MHNAAAGPTGTVYGGEVEDHPVNFTAVPPAYGVQKYADVADGNVAPLQEITYVLGAANTGPVAAPASFTDDLADILDDADLISGPLTDGLPNNGAVINGNTLSWSGTLAPGGGTVTVQYTVRVRQQGGNGHMPNAISPAARTIASRRFASITAWPWRGTVCFSSAPNRA